MRARLIGLVLACTLPVVAISVIIGLQLADSTRRSTQAHVQAVTRALADAVDRELARTEALLQVLASANSIAAGDYDLFRARAQRFAAAGGPVAFDLFDPAGRHLARAEAAIRRFSSPQPHQLRSVREAAETAALSVTDVFPTEEEAWIVCISLPVLQDRRVTHVLSATIPAATFSKIIGAHGLPEDWTAAVLDQSGTVLGRNRDPERHVGKSAVPELRTAIAQLEFGILDTITREGEPVFAAFRRLQPAGWAIATGVPKTVLEAPSRQMWRWLAGAALAVLAIGLLLALVLARRIADPIRSLAESAAALGQGSTPPPPIAGLIEADVVGSALAGAARGLQARQRELEASEQRFLDIAANFPGVIVRRITWPDGRIEYPYVSSNAARLFGFPPETTSSIRVIQDFAKYANPEDLSQWWAAVSAAAERLQPLNIEGRLHCPDGQVRWFRSVSRPHRGPDGSTIWDGVVLDVTAQKQAELARQESEQRLRLAIEAAGASEWFWDRATNALDLAQGMKASLGLSANETTTADEFRERFIHPDDRESARQAYRRGVQGEGDYQSEYRLMLIDGAVHWFLARGRLLQGTSGANARMTGVLLDINERKLAEERQHRLMAELDHRVKNVLSVVQALAQQSLRGGPQDVSAFTARIAALARTHNQLAENRWAGADLHAIVAGTLRAYGDAAEGRRFAAHGPKVRLSPKAAQSIGLVMQELATNAAKYGAVSNPDGNVEVGWQVRSNGDRQLVLNWVETGGPVVQPPSRQGFGMRFIEFTLSHELNGDARIDYAPGGLRVTLELPLAEASPGETELLPTTYTGPALDLAKGSKRPS